MTEPPAMRHDDRLTWWQVLTAPILAAVVILPGGLIGALVLGIIHFTERTP